MSPKHKLITTVWCSITMVATMILSHGHMILREIMTHWPQEDSWEGRFETALYTQGGLVFVASFVVGGVILVRSYFNRMKAEEVTRKELAQRERHERAAATRHEALMGALVTSLGDKPGKTNGTEVASGKKPHASGARPR